MFSTIPARVTPPPRRETSVRNNQSSRTPSMAVSQKGVKIDQFPVYMFGQVVDLFSIKKSNIISCGGEDQCMFRSVSIAFLIVRVSEEKLLVVNEEWQLMNPFTRIIRVKWILILQCNECSNGINHLLAVYCSRTTMLRHDFFARNGSNRRFCCNGNQSKSLFFQNEQIECVS